MFRRGSAETGERPPRGRFRAERLQTRCGGRPRRLLPGRESFAPQPPPKGRKSYLCDRSTLEDATFADGVPNSTSCFLTAFFHPYPLQRGGKCMHLCDLSTYEDATFGGGVRILVSIFPTTLHPYLRVEKFITKSPGNRAMKARPGGLERWNLLFSTPFSPILGLKKPFQRLLGAARWNLCRRD